MLATARTAVPPPVLTRRPYPEIWPFTLVVPLSFSAAGHLGPQPPQAIAGMATVSYGSSLIAPAAVGAIASAASLPAAFILITVLTAGIPLGARLTRSAEVTAVMPEPAAG